MSEEPDVVAHRRRFIREFDAAYCIPDEWDVIRVLFIEDRLTGAGTNTKRVYTCLCQEVESD